MLKRTMLISPHAIKGQVREKDKRIETREREREGDRVKITKRQKEKLNGHIQSEHEMDPFVVSLVYESLLITFIMLYLGIR